MMLMTNYQLLASYTSIDYINPVLVQRPFLQLGCQSYCYKLRKWRKAALGLGLSRSSPDGISVSIGDGELASFRIGVAMNQAVS